MKARTNAPRARLELDRLEERATPTASVVSGNLVIVGTTGNDNVAVFRVGSNFRVRENGAVTNFAVASVTGNVQFTGDAGNDRFVNLTALPTVADGGAGNDILVGGHGVDELTGGDGNDTLSAGLDTKGSKITGGLGADHIAGSRGNDTLVAGTGGTSEGDTGRNFVAGLAGDDTITGAAGDDILWGGLGNDTINAGAGNDHLYGDFGADTLDAGEGDDFLHGGLDNAADSLTGGGGVDRFANNPLQRFLPNAKKDTLVDFTEGTDRKGLFLF